jgi:hypothetical protein
MIFLVIILISFGSGIRHPAAPSTVLTNASFGKLILFEVMCSKFPRVSGLKMSFFP